MKRSRANKLIVIALVGMFVLAACGGDDSSSASSDTKSSFDNSSSSTLPKTGDSTYDQLLKKAETSRYRVTYKSSDSGKTFTVSHDPPKSAFLSGDTMFIKDGNDSITCTGVGTSDASCIKLSVGGMAADAMTRAFFGMYAALASADSGKLGGLLDVKKTSDETIAGRSTTCAEIDATRFGSNGSLKSCIDKETGVLLLGQTSGSGSGNKIEATDFGDPQASDFEPPVAPSSLPSMSTPST